MYISISTINQPVNSVIADCLDVIALPYQCIGVKGICVVDTVTGVCNTIKDVASV